MRLGGPVFVENGDPELWARAHRDSGYSAAFDPGIDPHDEGMVNAFIRAAKAHDLILAEIGAWSNPIAIDEDKRRQALSYCQERLSFAERVGARCCVNIAGARGDIWDGPYADNLSEATFELIVDTIREIIDAVRPTRTFYTLETMPWIFPDSADNYLRLIKAIDRKGFAVHLDPVNLINNPMRYFHNADLLNECFNKLGPYIKSCHAKDISLNPRLTLHLDETRPGLGALDYKVFLQHVSRLDHDTPLMMEHLSTAEEYGLAADYIRSIAIKVGVTLN